MTSNEHFSTGTGGNSSTPTSSRSNRSQQVKSSLNKSNQIHHQQHQQHKSAPECYGCHKPILERYFLKALDQIWHEDCLKCSCCNCRLGEIGSTLFTKADLILCKRDYLRMFGATGFCSLCSKQIPAFEMVMRARGNVYHLECFKCEACNHRFCVGDRFYLHDNKILCEYDYEEQMTLNQIHQQQQQQQQQQQHHPLAPLHHHYPHQNVPHPNYYHHHQAVLGPPPPQSQPIQHPHHHHTSSSLTSTVAQDNSTIVVNSSNNINQTQANHNEGCHPNSHHQHDETITTGCGTGAASGIKAKNYQINPTTVPLQKQTSSTLIGSNNNNNNSGF